VSERSQRAERVVREWAEQTMGWGPDRVGVHAAPHLSTPRFDLVTLAQRGMRSAGELYAMTDGDRVLPAGAASLGRVLAEEGLPGDPRAVPPERVAELFFRMAEVGRGRPIVDPGDAALERVPAEPRAEFTPPAARREDGGALLEFWSERGLGGDIERWRVRVGADGTLEREVETVG
jgi:hypothetical protein